MYALLPEHGACAKGLSSRGFHASQPGVRFMYGCGSFLTNVVVDYSYKLPSRHCFPWVQAIFLHCIFIFIDLKMFSTVLSLVSSSTQDCAG